MSPEAPVFALEHGLNSMDLDNLKTQVRASFTRDLREEHAWLPHVVYATEVGYEYSGDEFWPIYQEQTPHWEIYGDKWQLRSWFERFASDYGGAVAEGAWAGQFSIIAWPITHAILPRDLQSKLARLLFENRHAVTQSVAVDPPALGKLLADRAKGYTNRFRHFAENPILLGYVASALLTGDDNESPLLLPDTLRRIVAGLSEQEESRTWLVAAKNSARTGGRKSAPPEQQTSEEQDSPRSRTFVRNPTLSLRQTSDGLAPFVDLTSVAVLLGDATEAVSALRTRRAIVHGSLRKLPPGDIVRSPRPRKLESWPTSRRALLALEGVDESVNRLLAERIAVSSGPVWLFVPRGDGTFAEQRSRVIHPGRDYVVAGELPEGPTPDWANTMLVSTGDVDCLLLHIPEQVTEAEETFLRELGMLVDISLDVTPAGVAPGLWDGHTSVAWYEDDPTVVRVAVHRSDGEVLVADGRDTWTFLVPPDGDLFIDLGPLDVGEHGFTFHSSAETHVTAGTPLSVTILESRFADPAGEPGQGMQLMATSAAPTLTRAWTGKDRFEFIGPDGVKAHVYVSFDARDGTCLADATVNVTLPQYSVALQDLLDSKQKTLLESRFDRAEGLTARMSIPHLGSVELTAEREFQALRWVFGTRDRKRLIQLSDNTDLRAEVALFDYTDPVTPQRVDAVGAFPPPELGGLLEARAGSHHSRFIVPVSREAFRELKQNTPRVTPSRTVDHVTGLFDMARAWSDADLPGEPIARYQQREVLRVITATITGSLRRTHWSSLDVDLCRHRQDFDQEKAEIALVRSGISKAVVSASRSVLRKMSLETPTRRVTTFATLAHKVLRSPPTGMTRLQLSDVILRCASDPTTVFRPTSPLTPAAVIDVLFAEPLAFALARYVVLLVDDFAEPTGIFGDWVWL